MQLLPAVDEAIAWGLVEERREAGGYRFVHALTRDAVEASLTAAERAGLHRRAAEAIEERFADDLSEHLVDLARHWTRARAVRRRRRPPGGGRSAPPRRPWPGSPTRRACASTGPRSRSKPRRLPAGERCRVQVALGRAAYLAGDLPGASRPPIAAADAAARRGEPGLAGEAALVLEAVPDAAVNAVAKQLCEEALTGLGDSGPAALRARLLAQRSHLAFYDGEQDRVRR